MASLVTLVNGNAHRKYGMLSYSIYFYLKKMEIVFEQEEIFSEIKGIEYSNVFLSSDIFALSEESNDMVVARKYAKVKK